MAIVQLDKILSGVNGNLEHVVVYNENTYATKLNTLTIVLNGVVLAFIGLLITYLEVKKDKKFNLIDFRGYPISVDTIYLPII